MRHEKVPTNTISIVLYLLALLAVVSPLLISNEGVTVLMLGGALGTALSLSIVGLVLQYLYDIRNLLQRRESGPDA